uniref:Pribosyltran_N domain-containing protein n=1 Tax=Meloidogyne hapla TaxID=6305 RepID=A0A1I8BR61_MELHA
MAKTDANTGMVLLTGNSHPELANLLAENVNNNVMEMLILIYACKTSMAKTITVVLPYMPYSKQCRMFRRSSVPMKLVADMICKAGRIYIINFSSCISGASRVVSLDLYRKEIQGFFGIPVDNLRASPFLLHYIIGNIPDYKDAVIVAKNPGVMNKATSYTDRLKLGIAVIHGEQKVEEESGREDGRQSPPTASLGVTYEFLPPNVPKDKPPLTIVGDVSNKSAIIVDDIIDDAFSFVAVAEIIVTNTVPHEIQKQRCHKIKTVDISLLLCEAIRRIYNNESQQSSNETSFRRKIRESSHRRVSFELLRDP